MSRKRINPSFVWTLEVVHCDGSVSIERSTQVLDKFEFLVGALASYRSHSVSSVRLIDNRGKIYKEYNQYY